MRRHKYNSQHSVIVVTMNIDYMGYRGNIDLCDAMLYQMTVHIASLSKR